MTASHVGRQALHGQSDFPREDPCLILAAPEVSQHPAPKMDLRRRVRFSPCSTCFFYCFLHISAFSPALTVAVEPVLTVSGSYNVMLLVNARVTSPSTNATCTESNPAVFPVLLGAVNLIQWLEAETNISVGLTVYDACGPVQRLFRHMNKVLADEVLTPRAIITMTTPETALAVADVIRHTGVLYVDVTSDPLEDSVVMRDDHYAISNTPRGRVEMTLRLLDILRINYFLVSYANNHAARMEAELFQSLVQQSETLCVATPSPWDGSDYPLIVFTGNGQGESTADAREARGHRNAKIVVVVGDHADVVSNDVRQTILWLQNVVDVTQQELKSILRIPAAPAVLSLDQPLCASYHLVDEVPAVPEASRSQPPLPPPEACLLSTQTLRDILAVRDAVSLLTVHAIRQNASEDLLSDLLLHSMDAAALPFEEEVMSHTVREAMYKVRMSGPGAPREVDNSTRTFTYHEGTLSVPTVLLQTDVGSSCEVNCHLCDVCLPQATSDEKVMTSVSLASSSLVVVAIFPVHTSSHGVLNDCSAPNPDGYAMARSFFAAVESFNARTTTTSSNNVNSFEIGGMVVDSCSQRHRPGTVVRNLETCFLSFRDLSGREVIISPSRVISYVATASPGLPLGVDKLFLSVNETSVRVQTDHRMKYTTLAARVLSMLNWTYLRVVVPREKMVQKEILETFALSGLCVSDAIDGEGFLENGVDESTFDASKGASLVFLTDAVSTVSVLDVVNRHNRSSRLNYVFMPWNADVAYGRSARESMNVAVLIARQVEGPIPSHAFPSYEINDPWKEEFTAEDNATHDGHPGTGTEAGASVSQAVSSFLSALDSVYKEMCPEQNGLCKAFTDFAAVKERVLRKQQVDAAGLRIVALRQEDGRDWRETQIGSVLPNDTVILLEGAHALPPGNCSGWCPECFSCPSPAAPGSPAISTQPRSSLAGGPPAALVIYKPGDILLVGVFPASRPGSRTFQCGDLANNLAELRAEQSFLFAIDTFHARYEDAMRQVRIGGLLLDSCSSLPSTLHTLGLFQSCRLDFAKTAADRGNIFLPTPSLAVGYVLQDVYETASVLRNAITGMGRMSVISSSPSMSDGSSRTESPFRMGVDAMLSIFRAFQWSHAYVVTSEDENLRSMADYFADQAGPLGLCIVKCHQMKPRAKNLRNIVTSFAQSSAFIPAVLFLSRADAVMLFRSNEISRVTRPWLVSLVGDDWLTTVGVNFPWGTLLIDVLGKVNDDFHVFLENFSTTAQPLPSPWWQVYLQKRFHCQPALPSHRADAVPSQTTCSENPLHTAPMHSSPAASRVVRAVDSLLHAVDRRYKAACPEERGLCQNMTDAVLLGNMQLAGVRFTYEGGLISYDDNDNLELTLAVMSHQPGGLLTVGTYRATGLSLNASSVRFFTNSGLPLTLAQPNLQCRDCACVNAITSNTTGAGTAVSTQRVPLRSGLWWSQQGAMVMEVWSYAVLGIAVAGALVTLLFILFVLFKVWQGALAKRYIGLGLLLLLAVTLLYLSALPFVLTPSATVCALRYACPAVTYCLCFAVILVKLMALQDYRRIGLGGELSGVNQALSVFFIVLVQVSISAQWWWFHQPFLLQADDAPSGSSAGTGTGSRMTYYACAFERRSFVLCLAFVVFLILLCAAYSLVVRKEKKNAGEARLLLLSCWLAAAVWLTWVTMLLSLEPRWAPLLCSAGVLATASAVLLVVFVPKVRLVARLKYDLSKKHGSGAARNGYSIDTDFLYERPYSLPGTLTSTYSTIRTYPKSVTANFDSSLSY